MSNIFYLRFTVLTLFFLSCNYGQQKKKNKSEQNATQNVVAGYDFAAPQIWQTPAALREISGIAFYGNSNDSIYAEQDEEGNLYHFKLGDTKSIITKFGKKGDYEDISISNGTVFILRSDGTVYSFPLTGREPASINEWTGLVPQGEYEGMFADPATNLLYILCKHCGSGKTKQETVGYIYHWESNRLTPKGSFSIDTEKGEISSKKNKLGFHPSALAKDAVTKQWFILSSVNKTLVITDENWKIKSVHPLDPLIFNQPEGIAFDKAGNLYISNEAGNNSNGTILRFRKTGSRNE